MQKISNASLATSLLLFSVLACTSASAQTMYRCGNVYQAYPCETGQGKVVGSVGKAQSSYTPVSNAECAQRGAETLKIVWAREAGLIRDKALSQVDEKPLSSAQKAEAKKLITQVYNKRGSAPEIRAAIEADCVAEKEKEAMAATYRPVNSSADKSSPSGKTASGTNDLTSGTAGTNRKEGGTTNDTRRKEICDNLSRQLDNISRAQRAGADVRRMEELNQERRDILRNQLDAGC